MAGTCPERLERGVKKGGWDPLFTKWSRAWLGKESVIWITPNPPPPGSASVPVGRACLRGPGPHPAVRASALT